MRVRASKDDSHRACASFEVRRKMRLAPQDDAARIITMRHARGFPRHPEVRARLNGRSYQKQRARARLEG
jgi:hypothetical protein